MVITFKTDHGGKAVQAEIKLSDVASTWSTRLSQIGRSTGKLIICTEKLLVEKYQGNAYIRSILDKRDAVDPGLPGVTLIVNGADTDNACELLNDYPDMTVVQTDSITGTVILSAPDTVWVSTEGFGRVEKKGKPSPVDTIGFHSKDVYDYYLHRIASHVKKYGEKRIN